MFFVRQRSVLYYDGAMVRAVVADHFGRCSAVPAVEIPWGGQGSCEKVKSDLQGFPRVARLVLSERKIYSLTIPLPGQGETSRSDIERHIREMVPEQLNDILWDFSLTKRTPPQGGKAVTYAHCLAIRKELLESLIKPLQEAGFVLETIDAESCALARPFKGVPEPFIIAQGGRDGMVTLVASYRGLALASDVITRGDGDSVKRFLASVEGRTNLKFRKALISPEMPNEIVLLLSGVGIESMRNEFSLCKGAMGKRVLYGKDALVLNLARLSEVRNGRGILRA